MADVIKKTLSSILREEGLDPDTCYEIQDEGLVQCLSSVYKVSVKVKCDEKLDLFFKYLPDSQHASDSVDTEIFFRNEVVFYNEVMKRFLKFQREKNVKNPFCSVAKCYTAVSDGDNDIIVMEDLKPKG